MKHGSRRPTCFERLLQGSARSRGPYNSPIRHLSSIDTYSKLTTLYVQPKWAQLCVVQTVWFSQDLPGCAIWGHFNATNLVKVVQLLLVATPVIPRPTLRASHPQQYKACATRVPQLY